MGLAPDTVCLRVAGEGFGCRRFRRISAASMVIWSGTMTKSSASGLEAEEPRCLAVTGSATRCMGIVGVRATELGAKPAMMTGEGGKPGYPPGDALACLVGVASLDGVVVAAGTGTGADVGGGGDKARSSFCLRNGCSKKASKSSRSSAFRFRSPNSRSVSSFDVPAGILEENWMSHD